MFGGVIYFVVIDWIEFGIYMLVFVICGGEVELLGGCIDLLVVFCEKLD